MVNKDVYKQGEEIKQEEHDKDEYERMVTSLELLGVDTDCRYLVHADEEVLGLPIYNPVTRRTIRESIGEGGQGRAFLLDDEEGNRIVKKIADSAEYVLIEYNALEGLARHPIGDWHDFAVIDVGQGRIKRGPEFSHIFRPIKMEAFSHEGRFCIGTTYVEGRSLRFFNGVFHANPLIALKRKIAFFIMALRQIQAVHFTLNGHEAFDFPLFEKGAYANHHGDLHSRNIIIQRKLIVRSEYLAPILIDYGLSVSGMYDKPRDYEIGYYNYIQREEAEIEELNHIHRLRILNIGQRMDMCAMALLLILLMMDRLDLYRPRLNDVCRNFGEQLYNNIKGRIFFPFRIVPASIIVGLFPLLPILNFLYYLTTPYANYWNWRSNYLDHKNELKQMILKNHFHFILIITIICINGITPNRLLKDVDHQLYAKAEQEINSINRTNYVDILSSIRQFRYNEVCKALDLIMGHYNLTLPKTLAITRRRILKKLGEGSEGSAYLIKNVANQKYVTKISTKPHSIMIEYNAELAFRKHPVGDWHTFDVLGISYGRLRKPKERIYIQRYEPIKANLLHKHGSFCIDTTYIEGQTLLDMKYLPIIPSVSIKKQFYAFIIMILRQIQAVHFTTNHHTLFHHPFFGRHTYANHHSDMNGANIICTLKRFHTNSYYVPTLIDYGLSIKNIFFEHHDFSIYAYNQHLRNERNIRKNNRIHVNRIFNRGQRIDYCAIATIIILFFRGSFDDLDGKLSKICSETTDKLFVNMWNQETSKSPLQYLPLFVDSDIKELLHLMHHFLVMSIVFATYKSWIRLLSYFTPI
ncbi:hypothetical protein SNEBB_005118 [Seison nebaliae]|nr:hypothetical protein SNEBB_005118 [Seison nebaliae]